MSVILDALKKADHDRSLMGVPTLASAHEEAAEPRRRVLPWAVAAAVLAGGGLGMWVWPNVSDGVRGSLPTVARPAADLPDATSRTVSSKPRLSSEGAERSVGTAIVPKPSGPAERPSTAKSVASPKSPPGSVAVAPRPRAVRVAAQESPRAVPSQLQEADRGSSETELGEAETTANPATDTPLPAVTASPASPAPNLAPPQAARKSEPATLRLREAMGKMTLNGVVYSERPADRKVYISGRGYFEGDTIDGIIRVEEIQPEGATLVSHGERALLRLSGKR
jgi:hypothetical protein